jgi:hypothetical protein
MAGARARGRANELPVPMKGGRSLFVLHIGYCVTCVVAQHKNIETVRQFGKRKPCRQSVFCIQYVIYFSCKSCLTNFSFTTSFCVPISI